MNSILERVSESPKQFMPLTPNAYQAFQIARKLKDTGAFRHYLILSEHHSIELLVRAFHLADPRTGSAFMQAFHQLTDQP